MKQTGYKPQEVRIPTAKNKSTIREMKFREKTRRWRAINRRMTTNMILLTNQLKLFLAFAAYDNFVFFAKKNRR